MKLEKYKTQITLKKTQGTLTKITTMIDDDRYCPEIIQQIDAAIGLLRSARRQLLENHLNHCLEHKLHENKKQTIEELLKLYNLGGK